MTVVTGKNYAVGLRYVQIWALNATGSPAATDTSVYEGYQLAAAKAFDVTIPEPSKIVHTGDDRVKQTDFLPSKESITAELNIGRQDLDIYEMISGNKDVTVGEAKLAVVASDNQGSESQVGMLAFQQALDENGARNYQFWLFSKVLVYQNPGSMNENTMEHRYSVNPQVVTAYPWEHAFSESDEGALEGQGIIGQAVYKPRIAAWLASTATTEFTLNTNFPCVNTAKLAIFVDGTLITEAITKTTAAVQFSTAPGNNKRVVAFYEHNS